MKDFFHVLEKLGVNPEGATGTLRFVRTKKFRLAAGFVLVGSTWLAGAQEWTVTYDGIAKNVISTEQRIVRNYGAHNKQYLSTTIVLVGTSGGVQQWAVPQDWNNDSGQNFIEAIGPGGTGGNSQTVVQGGAGGGAYARSNSVQLIPRGTANYMLPAGGSQLDAWLSSTAIAPTTTAQGVLADAGSNSNSSTGAPGGQVANCIGDVKFKGGTGGNGGVPGFGGGAGAGGPGGAGGDGGAGTGSTYGGGGGAPNLVAAGNAASGASPGVGAGASGSAGVVGTPSSAGGDGSFWVDDAIRGSGAGSGGGLPSGRGGLYGGASGGSASSTPSGSGAQGLIRITYTPAVTKGAETMWRPQPQNLKLHGRQSHSRTYLHRLRYNTYSRNLPFHLVPFTPWRLKPAAGTVLLRNQEPDLQRKRDGSPELED